jgi:hypothetical protein
MKKWLSIAAVVVLCLTLVIGVACGGGGAEEEGVTEIELGFGAPLSGIMGAVAGMPAGRAMELLAEQIGVFEVGGKQYRWKIIHEDNEGASASGGVATTTKFIYTDHVDFVLQAGAAALTGQTLCEENGVIIDMGSTQFEGFGPDHPYSIQSGPSVFTHVAAFYDWLAEEHPEVKRIVVVASDDPLTIAFAEAFESNMHEYFGFEREIVWSALGAEPMPVATNVMTVDPDLVIASTQVVDIMWDMGYEGLSAINGAIMTESYLEDAGWDDCKGLLLFFPECFGAEEVWPEAVAFAREYKARYDVEMQTVAFWGVIVQEAMTAALQAAGTVDDTEKIMETVHSRTILDSMIGPVYYGGEAFVGVNCLLMWPTAIWEVVGEREYELLDYYTPEEGEAIAAEAWTATMP